MEFLNRPNVMYQEVVAQVTVPFINYSYRFFVTGKCDPAFYVEPSFMKVCAHAMKKL